MIVEGEDVDLGEYPYFVQLISLPVENPFTGFGPLACSGTLIAPDVVLTAAHCNDDCDDCFNGGTAIVGAYQFNSTLGGAQVRTCVDFVQHPEYVNATNASPLDFYDHDVGLCKLNEPVDIDTSTVTLELNEDASVPTTGDEMTVVGLGFESLGDLYSLTYPNITQDITLTADTNCTLSTFSENPELKFCSSDIGRGVCLADNGGPVVTKSGGVHTLIGLTSYFEDCHLSTFPVVFSRTSASMPWINAAICDLGSVSESCTTKKEKKSKVGKKSKSKKSKKSKSKKSKKSKNKKSKSEKSEIG